MKTNRIIRYPSLSVQMTLKTSAKVRGRNTNQEMESHEKLFELNINKRREIDESFIGQLTMQTKRSSPESSQIINCSLPLH